MDRIEPTRHYFDRCQERRIPEDAAHIVARYGRRVGWPHNPRMRLSRCRVYEIYLASGGRLELWDYEDIVVVYGDDGRAITAFRDARRE